MKYKVNEIFRSIQGEGFWSGRVAVFVRLSGCNLSCHWCDTDHSMKYEMTTEEIAEEVARHSCDYVVLTGGEPMIQLADNPSLVMELKAAGYYIAIETNGTIPVACPANWLTISPKTEVAITHADEVKVVLAPDADPDHWRERINASRYYIQPMNEDIDTAIGYVMQHPEWHLSLQLNKIAGVR